MTKVRSLKKICSVTQFKVLTSKIPMHPIELTMPLCSEATVMMMMSKDESNQSDEEEPEPVSSEVEDPNDAKDEFVFNLPYA